MKAKFSIGLLIALIAVFFITKTPFPQILLASPLWVQLVFVLTIISAILTFKYTLEERKIEKEWIEKEGNVYLDRMKSSREEQSIKKISS